MKILHFVNGRCNPDTANGVEKTIYNLAINQATLGYKVYIIGISSKAAISIPDVTLRYFTPNYWPWRLPAGLFEEVRSIQPDIVHFHSMYVPANVLLAAKLRSVGIPYAVTPNGNCSSHLLKRRPHLKLPYKFLFERPYINKSLFVHSVGDTQAIKGYGVTTPIVVEPNGIDRETIPSTPGSNPILSARPEWKKKTIFSFIGRLDTEQKGLDLMLNGVAEATRRGVDIGLVLVGPDWKNRQKGLLDMVKQLGIQSSVHFAGSAYAGEKFDYLLSSDFFVHTSRWEGLSFSVIEALACGKPCLVTQPANPCGLIGPYAAGLEIGLSVTEIADGFIEMSQTGEAERANMAGAARLLVDTELRWPRIAETVTAAYQS